MTVLDAADDHSNILSVTGISKSFPGVQSLKRVDFSAKGGEIHALVGENGAGKSTLTKIISGAYVQDEGEITLNGEKVFWSGPGDAQRAGIHVIYQELVLFPELTVAENVFINDQPLTRLGTIDYHAMARRADDVLRRLGAQIDVRQRVKNLSVADQQMVEIARAFIGSVKVLILDEPTAVIFGVEVDLLFERLLALRAAGVAIIYISHRLEEIFRIADQVTVLKDGVRIATRPVTEVDRDKLISMMVGRPLTDIFPPRRRDQRDAPIILRAVGMNVGRGSNLRHSHLDAVRFSGSLVLLVQVGRSSRKLSSVDYRLTPVKLRSTERYSLKRHRAPRLRRGLAYSPRTAKARAC